MQSVGVAGLADWRRAARRLIGQGVSPADIVFTAQGQDGLFAPLSDEGPPPTFRVPADFLALAEDVSMHRSPTRWALLYRTLYRLVHGERHLLEIIVDPDVRELSLLQKAVRRDIHKMHAFVRFRKVEGAEPEQFVAWHRPDHLIVERVGPWFAKRFGAMHWAILTPDQSVY